MPVKENSNSDLKVKKYNFKQGNIYLDNFKVSKKEKNFLSEKTKILILSKINSLEISFQRYIKLLLIGIILIILGGMYAYYKLDFLGNFYLVILIVGIIFLVSFYLIKYKSLKINTSNDFIETEYDEEFYVNLIEKIDKKSKI